MAEIPCFGVPGARKIMKLMMLARSQHPHNQKLCGKRSISTQKHPTKKNIFFAEKVFSQYFPLFSTPQHLDFRDFADLGMCPSLTMVHPQTNDDSLISTSVWYKDCQFNIFRICMDLSIGFNVP